MSKISLKMKDYDKTYLNTRLEFNINGKSVSYPLVNSIRRTALSDIPIYCWETTITKNTSVFHNNYMKNRIKAIPVLGIDNNIKSYTKDEVAVDENNDDEDNFLSMDNVDINSDDTDVNTDSLNKMNMFLKYENETKEIVTVSTDNCTFYYKGKKVDNPYKIPIPIIKLQPNQIIHLSCISKLGSEQDKGGEYSACSIFSYDMKDDNNYDIFVESRGQISEKEILLRSLEIIKNGVVELSDSIPDENDITGRLKIGDQDHTLGNLISYYALMDDDVEMFSYNLPHPLDRTINFNYRLKKGKLKKVFEKTVKSINNDLDSIKKQVESFKI